MASVAPLATPNEPIMMADQTNVLLPIEHPMLVWICKFLWWLFLATIIANLQIKPNKISISLGFILKDIQKQISING
jgi:hypothetical protein